MTFYFKLVQEYGEDYQAEPAIVFSDTTSPGLVPLWEAIGVYDSLYNSDGQHAREISRTLAYGLDRLNNDASLNNLLPVTHSNSAEAVRFLENVLRACAVHPSARVETS